VRRRDAPACGELSTSRYVWLYGTRVMERMIENNCDDQGRPGQSSSGIDKPD
jgi:hypothetical protein